MPNYQQGKIYTLRCRTDNDLIYVGSTTQPLSKRWGGHKKDSNRDKERLLYTTINDDWSNWYIELYELYPCESKIELCRKEGEIIREIGTLNSDIAGRTKQEWANENREWNKNWRENNKNKIKENFIKWNEKVECICGCIVNKQNLLKHSKRKIHIDALIKERKI